MQSLIANQKLGLAQAHTLSLAAQPSEVVSEKTWLMQPAWVAMYVSRVLDKGKCIYCGWPIKGLLGVCVVGVLERAYRACIYIVLCSCMAQK
jgi:hypothetical protein